MSFLRRRSVPDSVRAVLLDPADRRVGWAVTEAGQPVVATELGLHLPGRGLLPWHRIAKATWQRPVLTVVEIAEVDGDGATTRLQLAEEAGLPEIVNARVSDSVAWTQHVRVPAVGGMRIVGRRRRGVDTLEWQVVFDAGTDPGDPAVRAKADQMVAEASRVIG